MVFPAPLHPPPHPITAAKLIYTYIVVAKVSKWILTNCCINSFDPKKMEHSKDFLLSVLKYGLQQLMGE